MKVLVTGAAGYVGALLCHMLLERGHEVNGLDSLLYGRGPLEELLTHPDFRLYEGDVRDRDDVGNAMAFTDAVVHLAAIVGDGACDLDWAEADSVNVRGTWMVGDTAEILGRPRFVFVSTCSVYGSPNGLVYEGAEPRPSGIYGRSKAQAEMSVGQIGAGKHGKTVPVILRFGTLYGMSLRPRFDLVANLFAAQAASGRRLRVVGPERWRPFVHVADACAAIMAVLEAPDEAVRGMVYNVVAENLQFRDVAREALAATHPRQHSLPHVPEDGAWDEAEPDLAEPSCQVSGMRLRAHTGFCPIHYGLRHGLAEVAQVVRGGLDWESPAHSNVESLREARIAKTAF